MHGLCQGQTAGQGLLQGPSHPCEQAMAWLGGLHGSQKTDKSEQKLRFFIFFIASLPPFFYQCLNISEMQDRPFFHQVPFAGPILGLRVELSVVLWRFPLSTGTEQPWCHSHQADLGVGSLLSSLPTPAETPPLGAHPRLLLLPSSSHAEVCITTGVCPSRPVCP